MPGIYSVFIINKSGGLIFNKDFLRPCSLDLNDTLRLASMWHSMHLISQQLAPVSDCTGIDALFADTFTLHCFQTLTGTKFLMVVDPNTPDIDSILRTMIYELYNNYVLKNPFYEAEMPVKCELFDTHLAAFVAMLHRRWGVAI